MLFCRSLKNRKNVKIQKKFVKEKEKSAFEGLMCMLSCQNFDEKHEDMNHERTGEIVVYQPDEVTRLEVRVEGETVWLTQESLAKLFGVNQPAISKHNRNIYNSGELEQDITYSILEYMGNDGRQKYSKKYYNLDMILSVGYRVNSRNAIQFRRWANTILKEYLLKGYSVNGRLTNIERRLEEHEKKIDFFVRTSLPPVEGVFYDGQIFDAYVFASDLIRSAQRRVVLIDNYVDESVLVLLSKRGAGVSAEIRTGRLPQQFQLDLDRHNSQYPPVVVVQTQNIHDRFLVVDDTVYHFGVSLKDLGKKLFAFSKMGISPEMLIR